MTAKDATRLDGLRVLLAEDWFLVADSLVAWLEDLGAEIIGCSPSVDGSLEVLEREAVDVALLDVSLEDGLSYPVAERLIERGVPFVFITGHKDLGSLPERFQDAACLTKPVVEEDLVKAIKQATERPMVRSGSTRSTQRK